MDIILQILLLLLIFLLWTIDKWVLLYRVIRRKKYKKSLTKRERKLNKTYNKIRNDRTSNN
jgi:biopolymer transport protein ExbB/TolQ